MIIYIKPGSDIQDHQGEWAGNTHVGWTVRGVVLRDGFYYFTTGKPGRTLHNYRVKEEDAEPGKPRPKDLIPVPAPGVPHPGFH